MNNEELKILAYELYVSYVQGAGLEQLKWEDIVEQSQIGFLKMAQFVAERDENIIEQARRDNFDSERYYGN